MILKKLLLIFSLLFSTLLHADGTDIGISISNASSNENDNSITFTISIVQAPILPIFVNYTSVNGTAKSGLDYTADSDYLIFGAGISSRTLSIDLLDDNSYEGDEYFYVDISSTATGYVINNARGIGTIIDNEVAALTITTSNVTVKEDDGVAQASFKVQLNKVAPSGGVTLDYQTRDGSAKANSDYSPKNTSISIAAGQLQTYIQIPIIGDTELELQELFYLDLSNPTQGTLLNTSVTGTINDDDDIKVDISSTDVSEGNIGDNNKMEFKIFLTKPYPSFLAPLSINYQTQNGSSPSATTPVDYSSKSGSVTFNAGEIEKFVYVSIIGDEDIEADENLRMNISGSSYIIDNSSESEILNDDGNYPSISFDTNDFSILEGNTSQKSLDFTFTLDAPALANTSFQYYTRNKTAKTSDNDYQKISTKTYDVPLGATKVTISVQINGDTKIENDEYFYLKIKNEKKLTVSGHTAKGYILNDDGVFPKLSFNRSSYSINEGDSGQKDLNITLSLDQPAIENSYFKYYTSNNSAKTSDNDYVGISIKKHIFLGGETELTIPVKINGDSTIENDEKFYFKIRSAKNLKFSGTRYVKAYIINDDGNFPKVSIEATTLSFQEGDSNQTLVEFKVKLDAPSTEDGIYIKYKTYDSSAKAVDNDYEKIAETKVIFNIGEDTKTFYAYINGDTKVENNEQFFIKLYSPYHLKSNYSKRRINIRILNDDVHSNDPFTCDNSMYISSSVKRTTGNTGKMWLHKIDTTKNPFDFQVVEENGAVELYNATAYNPDDNYIYGLYHRELIQLTKTGKVNNLGTIAELPALLENRQLYAGAIYGGVYYVTGPGVAFNTVYKIKLSDQSVTELTLSQNVSIQDFSFSPTGTHLYGIEDGGKLLKVNVLTGQVSPIGSNHRGYQFDSSFSDINGRFFANDSNENGFFEFDLSTGNKRFLSASQPATYNDGANCINAALVFNDYGDAPSSYGLARHDIRNSLYLGDEVDHDIAAYSSADAQGDDSNGIDDEDGVTLADGSDINGSYFDFDTNHEITIKASKSGYLNVWIDYNIDGDFNDLGEQIFTAKALVAGNNNLSFNIPNNLTSNTTTYMRFRFSSTENLNATQNASDGEVEDYAIKFGTKFQGIKGSFNIQRTNSLFNAKDYALYTQIVSRDFNYHVVFYDENMTQEEELIKVPLKIELIDANDLNATPLYTSYKYFSPTNPSSRVPVLDSSDLDALPAVKEALFKITYAIDANGAIVQQECTSDYQSCFETLMALSNTNRTNEAKDKFAIRPESFFMSLADSNVERINSKYPDRKLRVAAGYDYNLTFIATQWKNQLPAKGYEEDFTTYFDFNNTDMTSCADTSDIEHNITFVDGKYNDANFSHNNVGRYTLTIQDDTNWTAIDQNENDCLVGKNITSSDGNSKSGCNITLQIHDIELEFQPHHFNVSLSMTNLPSSTHDDFIYMSELNSTYNSVAIQFEGNITAEGENNTSTSNFTAGCVASNLLLDLNASSISVEGINQKIQTINGTNVDFSRVIRFNNETNPNNFDVNRNISRIGNFITIDANRFLNDNNGTMSLDMRYNLNKHLSEPINPVEVTFNSIDVNASTAKSSAHGILNYIPSGREIFTNNVKNFYFARVVSTLNNYPRVNMNISPLVRTPLNVDIYCDINLTYCTDRRVLDNSNLTATTREQIGWYLSSNHNGELDGNVTNLEATPNIVSITPNPPTNIMLEAGTNGRVTEEFIDCSSPSSTITITTDPVLAFTPSEYTVNCTDANASQWTGIGQTGNVLSVTPKVNKSGKMDW